MSIEKILKPIFKAVDKLDEYAEKKDNEVGKYTETIALATVNRNEAQAEATRAAKIRSNLKSLLEV